MQKVHWRYEKYTVIESKPEALSGIDIAIMSAGIEASLELSPEAVKRECIVIDNSTAFRMVPKHPLVIPEVNADRLVNHQGIISNPNCSTIQMLVAIKPIHDEYRVKRVNVSTYQAVSGKGHADVDELQKQTLSYAKGEKIENKVYPHQIAFNIIPYIDSFKESGYSGEEIKMIRETSKILDSNIKITSTTVRVPVSTAHGESLNI